MPWKEIDHTADRGIEVTSGTIEGLFIDGASALYSIMFDRSCPEGRYRRTIDMTLGGMDMPDLAVQWLNELIYLWETERCWFQPVFIKVEEEKNLLTARGNLCELQGVAGRVKAATYGGLVLKTCPVFFLRVFLDV